MWDNFSKSGEKYRGVSSIRTRRPAIVFNNSMISGYWILILKSVRFLTRGAWRVADVVERQVLSSFILPRQSVFNDGKERLPRIPHSPECLKMTLREIMEENTASPWSVSIH